MKIINSSVFRAIVAFIAGGLMVQYREQMVEWFTKIIGVLFFVSGLISIVIYFVGKSRYEKESVARLTDNELKGAELIIDKPTFPLVGIGSIVLGVILFFMTTTFVTYLVYIFAVMLILGAVGEYVSLISTNNSIRDFKTRSKGEAVHNISQCGVNYWIIPTLLLLFGIFAILKPAAIASAPFLFIGVAMIVYGLSELIFAIKFYAVRRFIERQLALQADTTATVVADSKDVVVKADVVEEIKPIETDEEIAE